MPEKNIPQFLYRMRSCQKLLDAPFCELQNQELYFSRLDKLNDPYEGFLDVYWEGDFILWKNFLRRYLLSLYKLSILYPFLDANHEFTCEDIDVYGTESDFPNENIKSSFYKIAEAFFKDERINAFLNCLSITKRKMHEKDIKIFLSIIHPIAFESIYKESDSDDKKQTYLYFSNLTKDIPIQNLFERLTENPQEIEEKTLSILMDISFSMHEQLFLLRLYNCDDIKKDIRISFITTRFPNEFINKLITLTVPEAFVCSFMTHIDNPALWGYYADGHKGACLIFKCADSNGKTGISLNAKTTGSSDNIFSFIKFNKVVYTRKAISVNFFKFINTLPLDVLYENWYKDGENFTSYLNDFGINKDINMWRKELWRMMESRAVHKLPEWRKENEYRLVMNDFLRWDSDKEGIATKYNFESLDGIVFGYKMQTKDKLAIMKLIEKKCKENNRHTFNFYQAEYSFATNSMEIRKLDFLNIE
ncbi:MAG: DUF2971 domain-containing protein [Treponema sp.]|nr:DUF2971 domain-containing protein [Treponema sp.]